MELSCHVVAEDPILFLVLYSVARETVPEVQRESERERERVMLLEAFLDWNAHLVI